MKEELIVLNGSGINRKNIIFTIEALESSLQQSWKYGVPSCISHDLHRPFAWVKGNCLYFEPGLVRLVGLIFFPENEEDKLLIKNNLKIKIQTNQLENFEPYAEDLYNKLSESLTSSQFPIFTECACLIDKDLAKNKFPDIFKKSDKDDLIPLSELNIFAPGVYEKDGLLLFAHRFFRRSLSRFNTLNKNFLKRFQDIAFEYNLDASIALDPDMVGLKESYRDPIELEYWWGPKFSDELHEINNGVTKHEASSKQKKLHGITSAEFWWHKQNPKSVKKLH